MSLFDTNYWYTLYTKSNNSIAMHGGNVNATTGTGSVYLTEIGKTVGNAQLWQFYQHNDSYVIRCKGSGATNYMLSAEPDNPTPSEITGNTVPALGSTAVIDQGMFWQITPWKDNSYYFTNSANKTGWRMQARDGGNLLAISSNITKESRASQSFEFKAVSKIDDQQFSTIDTPSSTASASVSASSTAPAAASTTSSTSASATPSAVASGSHSGLSTGAKVAIGASIGGVVVLLLILAAIVRRMKRRSPEYAAMLRSPKDIHKGEVAKMQDPHADGGESHGYYKAELAAQDPSVSKSPSIARSELGTTPQDPRMELPATMQYPTSDTKNRYGELDADRSAFAPVELPAEPRRP